MKYIFYVGMMIMYLKFRFITLLSTVLLQINLHSYKLYEYTNYQDIQKKSSNHFVSLSISDVHNEIDLDQISKLYSEEIKKVYEAKDFRYL